MDTIRHRQWYFLQRPASSLFQADRLPPWWWCSHTCMLWNSEAVDALSGWRVQSKTFWQIWGLWNFWSMDKIEFHFEAETGVERFHGQCAFYRILRSFLERRHFCSWVTKLDTTFACTSPLWILESQKMKLLGAMPLFLVAWHFAPSSVQNARFPANFILQFFGALGSQVDHPMGWMEALARLALQMWFHQQ